MKPTSSVAALSMIVTAALVWGSAFWFSRAIDASAKASAEAIAQARKEGVLREADSTAIALASATAEARRQLSALLNKDALSLSNAISAAGADADIELTIGNVSQGPGPALPKGATLRPASVMFSVHAVGSFQKLFTLMALLSDLPAASSLDHVQLVRSSATLDWTLNADVRAFTSSPI